VSASNLNADETAPLAAAALDEAGNSLAPVQNDQGEEPRQPRERRSRDRYGRDRRERGENGERSESAADGSAVPADAAPDQAPAQQERAPVATEFVASVAAPAPAYTAPVLVAAAPVQVLAPAPETTALPKVLAYDLPLQDLAQVAQTSGLQWVNSDAAKIAEVQALIAAEVKPVHVPRERPPVVASTEAPLVLVETKRDLGTLPLPFETPVV
jgi:ribonuclease E